nr:hypothetical protein B0A51_06610 [Rachicladosporium sp. CCFEE 5018]
MWRTTIASVAFLSLASGAPTGRFHYHSPIAWTDCINASVPLKCATLSVPSDSQDPRSNHLDLFVTKIPARNASARIGNLFYNPGGPGDAPSSDLVPSGGMYKWLMRSRSTEYFDLIAIDPRGTGKSNPVQCDPTLWGMEGSEFPISEIEYDHMVSHWRDFGASCLRLTGSFLKYVDTESTARDFEAVRMALGDEPMNFLGFSYGTQLGSQYAELYPHNIRAMVLDANLDHSQTSPIYAWETESQGYENTLLHFFAWCRDTPACALHDETDILGYFDRLVSSANAHPITSTSAACLDAGCPPVIGENIMGLNTQSLLVLPNGEFGSPGWLGLAQALKNATTNGNVDLLVQLPPTATTNDLFSYVAIICADWPFAEPNESYTQYLNRVHMARTLSPHTRGAGEFWFLHTACQSWPVPPRNPPHEITTFKNPSNQLKTPILMVNALHDPETSYAWAANLQRQFGDANAVLLTRNGSGHTSYTQPGKVSDAIDEYLVRLKVPGGGTVLRNEGI